MYDDPVHQSDGNSATRAVPRARSLKIESEIIFAVKHPIPAGADAAAALAASEWLALGFAIIDCPFPEGKFQPSDFVTSFGLHAAVLIGDRLPVDAEQIPALADGLANFKLRMKKQSQLVEEGWGRNCLRSPALCLAELGTAIQRRFPNQPLRAGEIVSSGTLTAGHLRGPGDRWTAEIEGLPLPALSLKLE